MASTLKRRRLRRRITALLLLSLLTLTHNHFRSRPRLLTLRNAIKRAAFRPAGSAHGLVIVTAVNHAFRHYLTNLACTMSRHGHPKHRLLVLSLDASMHAHATHHGYHSILLAGADTHQHIFGSPGFNHLSKLKLHAVYSVLRTGVDVLFVDADIAWCTDAAAEIARQVYASPTPPHLLMQTAWPRSLLNSGLYYARAARETERAFHAFLEHDEDTENDQVIVNRVLCRGEKGETLNNGTYVHPSAPHRVMPVGCRWDGRVEARLLDAQRFPTGGEIVHGLKIFHHPRSYITHACAAGKFALLHNNCILSQKKKARFIAKGLWYVHDHSCGDPAPATVQARRACGGAKCGPEGDLKRYPDLQV